MTYRSPLEDPEALCSGQDSWKKVLQDDQWMGESWINFNSLRISILQDLGDLQSPVILLGHGNDWD